MDVPLYICCIFSGRFFLRTPLEGCLCKGRSLGRTLVFKDTKTSIWEDMGWHKNAANKLNRQNNARLLQGRSHQKHWKSTSRHNYKTKNHLPHQHRSFLFLKFQIRTCRKILNLPSSKLTSFCIADVLKISHGKKKRRFGVPSRSKRARFVNPRSYKILSHTND